MDRFESVERRNKLIQRKKDNPEITTTQLAIEFGISQPHVCWILKKGFASFTPKEGSFRSKSSKEARIEVINLLGGKCKWCEFSDHRALQIDHVNGRGRMEMTRLGWYSFYKKVREDTTGAYQLLCANCNWIKRCELNEYASSYKKST